MTPIEEARYALEELSREYNVPVPKLMVTEEISPGFIGEFRHFNQHIRIRPSHLGGRVAAHEFGHTPFHHLYPACVKAWIPGARPWLGR